MTKIEIYTKKNCPYCEKAKKLLSSKFVKFQEISIEKNKKNKSEMISRSGKTTVPQIFINNNNIGGYDDLYRLNDQGKLKNLLKPS